MFKPSLFVLCVLAATPSFAADPVTDAMQDAYAPYRAALFKTNSNAQSEAAQTIAQARQAWGAIVARFAGNPPAPYDRDKSFQDSLAKVGTIYEQAAAQIARNELVEAHETLEHARDVMADLRHRNNVSVFSDHMNAYHAQMEKVLIDGPKTLAGANGVQELTVQVGALEYLALRLEPEAPASLRSNDEFKGALVAVQKSVADLKAALFSQDATRIKEALGKVKAPYSKMFLKFG